MEWFWQEKNDDLFCNLLKWITDKPENVSFPIKLRSWNVASHINFLRSFCDFSITLIYPSGSGYTKLSFNDFKKKKRNIVANTILIIKYNRQEIS